MDLVNSSLNTRMESHDKVLSRISRVLCHSSFEIYQEDRPFISLLKRREGGRRRGNFLCIPAWRQSKTLFHTHDTHTKIGMVTVTLLTRKLHTEELNRHPKATKLPSV